MLFRSEALAAHPGVQAVARVLAEGLHPAPPKSKHKGKDAKQGKSSGKSRKK